MRYYPLCASALLLAAIPASAEVTLPRILSGGMIIQRDAPIEIWGKADAGEKVSVSMSGKTATTKADAQGRWSVELPELAAGGPYDIVVQGENTVVLKNVLMGDVWLCSGQSNMETPMSRIAERYTRELAESANDNIRFFTAPLSYNFHAPQDDYASGEWKSADPDSLMSFSGVAYFFARKLEAETGVPVAIINASNGGSPIASWMSEEALSAYPELLEEALRFRDDAMVERIEARNRETESDWYGTRDRTDPGLKTGTEWYREVMDCSDWGSVTIPGVMADQGVESLGTIWLRKDITIPAELAGQPALLRLGNMIHADTAWINGQEVGSTGYEYPPRRYKVPAGIIKEGRNSIAIRLTCYGGSGASFMPDKPYQLEVGAQVFDLKGEWLVKDGADMPAKAPTVFVRWMPMGLHNGMLGPLQKLNLKGFVWYQGESDTGRAATYGEFLRAMIDDWRAIWGQLPFIYAQLPNFMEPTSGPAESGWATLREQQRRTLSVPNTGMGVNIDLGEWNDIHPTNKLDVGERLALAALKLAYGRDIVSSGPLLAGMSVEGTKAVLSFDSVGGGLVAKDGPELRQFTIAGADGVFHMARAKICGDKVLVWSDEVKEPQTVRYAWASNPLGANLYNAEGLPASPFEANR
ncbi:MAG: hypothetical protein JW942_00170 [Opitutales bacterium]|nr:hypothetical protein [Opitutales bacterium]